MTFGEGLIQMGLTSLKQYIDAESQVIRDFMAGEIDEWLDIVDLAFTNVNIPRTSDGYEIDTTKQSRVCDYVPRGGPYPRIAPATSKHYFLRPKKMGGMSEVYLEDIVGKPEAIIELKTTDRMRALQEDFRLARLERAMLALDAAVTAAGSDYILDISSGNVVQDFTLENLQDLIQLRKQNWPIRNMRDLFLIIPSDVENQLRKDSAFDNSTDTAKELIEMGALPTTIMGLSAVFVNDQMPVLYDSTGKMLDAVAVPTGVPKLPIQFIDTTDADAVQALPPWLQEGMVDITEWTEDYVARHVWLIEKKKAGIYLTQDMPPEFPPVVAGKVDETYDSIYMKVRGMFNFGVPVDMAEWGVKHVARCDNIRLRWV